MKQTTVLIGIAVVLLMVGTAIAQDKPADVFKSKCAMCHGADGKGQTAMGKKYNIKDLASQDVQSKSDADLKDIIVKGKDKMPAYGGKLTDDQINGLVNYIRDFPKKK